MASFGDQYNYQVAFSPAGDAQTVAAVQRVGKATKAAAIRGFGVGDSVAEDQLAELKGLRGGVDWLNDRARSGRLVVGA